MNKESREKLIEEVEKNSRDEEVYDIYEKYSTFEMEKQSEIYEAIEKTTEEVTKKVNKKKAVEIAKKMFNEGLDISIILKTTGLAKEEIRKLA